MQTIRLLLRATTVLAWVYAGLSDEDAKTLALDHNVDSELRLSMSFLQKVRYFHNEWVDHLRQGKKADETFKVRLCDQVGLATKKSKKGEWGATKIYEILITSFN